MSASMLKREVEPAKEAKENMWFITIILATAIVMIGLTGAAIGYEAGKYNGRQSGIRTGKMLQRLDQAQIDRNRDAR